MTLPTPQLDDRKFQDIVREARAKIPQYCPGWTDYNLSDPGITLIELFAWMTDMLLYRLNRVPDKNYIKFMEMIGLHLETARPAQADLTFTLSAPQPKVVTIPRGTEVATIRTEMETAISFTTDRDLTVQLPVLAQALTSKDEAEFKDCLAVLKDPELQVTIFEPVPKENNALYLGYNDGLSAHSLALTIESKIEGIGVNWRDPPLAWEYWDGGLARWLPARLELDTTGGLNQNGQVILHLPYGWAVRELDGREALWLRCRATTARPGQTAYTSSPKITRIVTQSIGGTVAASNTMRLISEMLGRSDGQPGQRFILQNMPVLRREAEETVEVETDKEGEYEPWLEVSDFAGSGPEDKHFTLDSVSGEVQFGPAIHQPSGEEHQYGKVPPAGRRIFFTAYRAGGGVVGNVGAGTITVPKSSIPYVAKVKNYAPATGGMDSESLERAKLRAPQVIQARTRAVTAADYECLALEASREVARAKCLAAGTKVGDRTVPAGTVLVLLVPRVLEGEKPVAAEQLELTRQIRDTVEAYLDERRLLATRLEVGPAIYQAVAVEAHVKIKPDSSPEQTLAEVERRLYRYINPVSGGPDGTGWPFGRSLSRSEVFSIIQGTPNVEYAEEVRLFSIDPSGQRQDAGNRLAIPPDNLLYSAKHQVAAVKEE
jgi:predicted phage baseplate assembly protein